MIECVPCHEVWTSPASWHLLGQWITCAVIGLAFVIFGDPYGA